MKTSLKIHLRRNERLFVNGAVLKPDRKVTLEFMNDVVFLLESHVIQQEDATTPLRQLYFVIQSILIEPNTAPFARKMYEEHREKLVAALSNEEMLAGLDKAHAFMMADRVFEAMKVLRKLFPLEDEILKKKSIEAVA
jgi:flagellar protein FlbT